MPQDEDNRKAEEPASPLHDVALRSITQVAQQDERVRGAWLEGSLATSRADAYSDIDLHLLVSRADFASFSRGWRSAAERMIGPLVFAHDIPGVTGGFTLNASWLHLDLLIHDEPPTGPRAALVLLDRDDELSALSRGGSPARRKSLVPQFPLKTVEFYFYLLGNLVVTLGRGELILARGGIQALTDQWIVLMKAERGVTEVSGQKRLNVFLTEEQRRVIEETPRVAAVPGEIMAAAEHVTSDFVARGQRLAKRTGHLWPADLAKATAAHLEKHLGTDLGAGWGLGEGVSR